MKKIVRSAVAGVCLALGVLGSFSVLIADDSASAAKPEKPKTLRGMTISCWGWGAEWAQPGMAESMDELKKYGVNAISFHPYGWIKNDGRVKHRQLAADPTVLSPLKEAKKRKLESMVIPHIGYWGSKFSWRGEISFSTEKEWQRFFADYKSFIVAQAKLAEQGSASLFCVGIEYKKTLSRDKEWRDVIAAVRKVYSGKILYVANWDSYQSVPFWDAVDLIGVQCYFPVSTKPNPDEAALAAGWKSTLNQLKTFSEKHKKAIVLTELGYNLSANAAARPWEYEQGGENADAIKLRCMKIALAQCKSKDFIHAIFLWKWFPTQRRMKRNFMLQYKDMTDVIQSVWGDSQSTKKSDKAERAK